MNIQQAIAQVVDGQSLSRADMEQVMLAVMQGQATEAQIGGLLVGLRIQGETIDEIVGARVPCDRLRHLSILIAMVSLTLREQVETGLISLTYQRPRPLLWPQLAVALRNTVIGRFLVRAVRPTCFQSLV